MRLVVRVTLYKMIVRFNYICMIDIKNALQRYQCKRLCYGAEGYVNLLQNTFPLAKMMFRHILDAYNTIHAWRFTRTSCKSLVAI